MRSPVLFTLLGMVSVTVALVHYLALHFSLYWRYAWLDLCMHFLGGVTIGLLFLVILLFLKKYAHWQTVSKALLFVFCVGILWELFEIAAGISIHEPGFVTDTGIDLVMDLLGGGVGYYIGTRVSTL